jgi:eukaryotic-like serine/threonine-protein kinase
MGVVFWTPSPPRSTMNLPALEHAEMPETRRGSSPSHSPDGTTTDPSLEDFLQTLIRSQLIDPDRIEFLHRQAPRAIRGSARPLADYFIERGELTHYQIEKLLAGRWRGLVIGPYHILAPLGRGGMGTVYLAKSRMEIIAPPPYPLFPLVALKVLPPKRAREDERTLLRFRREMELGQHLNHPNITRTLDAGEREGVHYIAMEYVPGQSLRQLVGKEGPLPVGEAARLFVEVAAGLGHAHERGLIHRDLKPSNIMVTPEGRAKILDLGLALLVDETLPDDPSIVGGEGYILVTMDYISPEQTTDATNVGPHSDIYSLGCSIYYAVCGVPPFPGGTSKQKMQWQRQEAAPPAHSINPSVPTAFSRLLDRFMAKDAADRPASGESVRALLLPWAAEGQPKEDVSPFTDREVVAGLDSRHIDPALWDAVPVAELMEPAAPVQEPRTNWLRRWNQPEAAPAEIRQTLMYALGGCLLVVGIAALAIVLLLLRRL